MINQQQMRSRLLVATCGGLCLFTVFSLISPSYGKRQVSPFSFPDVAPLSTWELVSTHELKDQRTNLSNGFDIIQSGKRYQYVKNGTLLQLEMRYVVGTLGSIDGFNKDQKLIPFEAFLNQDIRQQKFGFYSLLVNGNQAYLTTCINPRGNSTVNSEQFVRNRKTKDLKPHRILSWILGQESLTDRRCLWMQLSTPIKESKPDAAYKLLETSLFEAYPWWQSRFPNH